MNRLDDKGVGTGGQVDSDRLFPKTCLEVSRVIPLDPGSCLPVLIKHQGDGLMDAARWILQQSFILKVLTGEVRC